VTATRYNVNAARAQRLEARGERWEFEIDGDPFSLPTEIPHRVVKALAALDDSDLEGMLELLLGSVQYQRFVKHEVSVQDIQALLEEYGRATGMFLGEGSASTGS